MVLPPAASVPLAETGGNPASNRNSAATPVSCSRSPAARLSSAGLSVQHNCVCVGGVEGCVCVGCGSGVVVVEGLCKNIRCSFLLNMDTTGINYGKYSDAKYASIMGSHTRTTV